MGFPQRLLDGYRAFADRRLGEEQARWRQLATDGQRPEIMVIGCCDSRVAPETIFDARPGELFVVRNVANLVPPYAPDGAQHAVSAAIEFAVQALEVKHIVILGHARCGGVEAYAQPGAPLSSGDFIGKWIGLIAPAARAIGPRRTGEPAERYLARLETASVLQGLANLMTFPWLRARVERGELALHGAYFGVATGELSVLDETTGGFGAAS